MAIRGSLREASLADVLQLLALGRKTGCLSVSDRNSFGRIYFDQGTITHASIVNRHDRLGDLLVKNGLVTPEQLDDAVREQGQVSRRIGEILVSRGAISRAVVERFIRLQVEEVIYFLFTWNQGTFYFEAGETPPSSETLVAINPENVLLEGARRVDEWALIQKKISSPDLIFRLDLSHGDPAEKELTEDQRRVLPLLDGQRTVREIIEESGLLEFEAYKAIFGLVQAGFARQHGHRRVAPADPIRRSRVQEHYNLGVAFLRTRMIDDAEREFSRILELEPTHLEAKFNLGLVHLRRERMREAIREYMQLIDQGGRWRTSFRNLALALEAENRVDHALLTVEEALAIFPSDAPLLLSRAILLTKQGRFASACDAFVSYEDATRGIDPRPAVYFAYSMLALAGSGRLREGRARAEEGVAKHPRSAPVLINAAAVLERAGAVEEVEELYRRAVEESPDLVQAQRGLADALYRRGAYGEAGEIYARLVDHEGADRAELSFKLGNIAYKAGDRDAAVRHWRAVLDADPEHAIARTNLELVAGGIAREGA